MEAIKGKNEGGALTLQFIGHIDSANAAAAEAAINEEIAKAPVTSVTIDAEQLGYISSVGLRIILRIKKQFKDTKIVNVCSEVYEVFDMTGFTEMMEVQKAYRKLSVDGCEVIGQGANGKVYRLDPDTIIKVYLNPDSLPDIHRERELARTAFVLGIPTAIPYDVVRVGDGYGSVFELLNAKSFAKIVINEPEKLDEVVDMYVDLMKKIHSTEVKPTDMPDMKAVALDWAKFLENHLPEDQYKKLCALIEAVPERHTMLHGDYHLKNVMLQNGESLLIDMDTLCYGHPVFEFGSIFLAYRGYSELDHEVTMKFHGFSYETGGEIWQKTLEKYFGTTDKAKLAEYEDKAKVIGYTRMLRRTIRRMPDDVAGIENCKKHLADLLPRIDSLDF